MELSPPLELPAGVELKWLEPVEVFEDPPWLLMAFALVCLALIVPVAISLLFGPPLLGPTGLLCIGNNVKKRVVLVVAHPDDEAMFFWPTLLRLRDAGVPTSVLCLSSGNAAGLGALRTMEMQRSCARLGIHGERVRVVEDGRLADGFRMWSEDAVAEQVAIFVAERGADLVLTFDDVGVSGHPNHISTSRGVRKAAWEATSRIGASDSDKCRRRFDVLLLDSVGLWRKYWGPLCLLWSLPVTAPDEKAQRTDSELVSGTAGCGCGDPFASLRALTEHWTQLVWYRVLFACFSHYAYVNTYSQYMPAAPLAATTEVTSMETETDAKVRSRRRP